MGRFGHYVIDADGHGGEPDDWWDRAPAEFQPRVAEYRRRIAEHFAQVPGLGVRLDRGQKPRAGMAEPAPRLDDMDLEGIDVTVMFPPGSGEEWALLDRDFAVALCATLNDARAPSTARTHRIG